MASAQHIAAAPRISAVLRAMLTSTPPLVVDDAFLARQSGLELRRQMQHDAEAHERATSQLTWASFAGLLANKPKPHVRTMRGKYKKLLGILSSEVIGSGATSEELYVSWCACIHMQCSCLPACLPASPLWHPFTHPHPVCPFRFSGLALAMPLLATHDLDGVRASLGRFEDSPSIQEACSLAADLTAWAREYAQAISGQADGSAGAAVRTSASICTDVPQYGVDMQFDDPSTADFADDELEWDVPVVVQPGAGGDDRGAGFGGGGGAAAAAAATSAMSTSSHPSQRTESRAGSDAGASTATAQSQSSSLVDTGVVDELWLLARCEQFLAANPASVFDAGSLSAEVLGVLQTRRQVGLG